MQNARPRRLTALRARRPALRLLRPLQVLRVASQRGLRGLVRGFRAYPVLLLRLYFGYFFFQLLVVELVPARSSSPLRRECLAHAQKRLSFFFVSRGGGGFAIHVDFPHQRFRLHHPNQLKRVPVRVVALRRRVLSRRDETLQPRLQGFFHELVHFLVDVGHAVAVREAVLARDSGEHPEFDELPPARFRGEVGVQISPFRGSVIPRPSEHVPRFVIRVDAGNGQHVIRFLGHVQVVRSGVLILPSVFAVLAALAAARCVFAAICVTSSRLRGEFLRPERLRLRLRGERSGRRLLLPRHARRRHRAHELVLAEHVSYGAKEINHVAHAFLEFHVRHLQRVQLLVRALSATGGEQVDHPQRRGYGGRRLHGHGRLIHRHGAVRQHLAGPGRVHRHGHGRGHGGLRWNEHRRREYRRVVVLVHEGVEIAHREKRAGTPAVPR
mmetsp:Transcript_8468/g.31655  ORF Transcript_8468/g.31655 Transcript_8468/m.31655 type:complete len:440 (+) Transcript_8468:230-1549(+)